jgi:DNA-binding transcriptional MerR regulator
MRLAELSRRSGVARSTLKFYLREGLLPPGDPVGRNQARYGERHVERLALIRALREVARLPLEVIARVAAELDRALAEGWESDADPVGEALRAIYAPPARARNADEQADFEKLRGEVKAFLHGLPWTTGEEGHFFADEIADALQDLRRYVHPSYPVAALAPYARLAWRLSEAAFAQLPPGFRVPRRDRGDDIAAPSRVAILSTVLFDRIFGALRRCANSMRSIRIGLGLEVPPAD